MELPSGVADHDIDKIVWVPDVPTTAQAGNSPIGISRKTGVMAVFGK